METHPGFDCCCCVSGVLQVFEWDPHEGMRVKGLKTEEKAVGSRSYVFDFAFLA